MALLLILPTVGIVDEETLRPASFAMNLLNLLTSSDDDLIGLTGLGASVLLFAVTTGAGAGVGAALGGSLAPWVGGA